MTHSTVLCTMLYVQIVIYLVKSGDLEMTCSNSAKESASSSSRSASSRIWWHQPTLNFFSFPFNFVFLHFICTEHLFKYSHQQINCLRHLETRSKCIKGSKDSVLTRSKYIKGSKDSVLTRSKHIKGSKDSVLTRSKHIKGSKDSVLTRSKYIKGWKNSVLLQSF